MDRQKPQVEELERACDAEMTNQHLKRAELASSGVSMGLWTRLLLRLPISWRTKEARIKSNIRARRPGNQNGEE